MSGAERRNLGLPNFGWGTHLDGAALVRTRHKSYVERRDSDSSHTTRHQSPYETPSRDLTLPGSHPTPTISSKVALTYAHQGVASWDLQVWARPEGQA